MDARQTYRVAAVARSQGGYSIIEIMIVMAIAGLVSGGAIVGFRSLVKTELRTTASRLAAAIRYSYDRAISTGGYYRLHLNLDNQTYRLERSDTRVLLDSEGGSKRGRDSDRGEDRDEADRKAQQEEERTQGSGMSDVLLPPPSPRRPKFATYTDSQLKPVQLDKIRVLDVQTPRQSEPYRAGHAYLHFFPDGHTERAVIHLGADGPEGDQFSLVVHGLTGRVEVLPGRAEIPADFLEPRRESKGGE